MSLTYYHLSVASKNVRTNKNHCGFEYNLEVRSIAYVLGKLVKPKFYTEVQCSAVLNQTKLGTPFSLKNSCQYDD
ncbi:hypothetical protein AMTRI_Chr02g259490 [Amborella trichopoda]